MADGSTPLEYPSFDQGAMDRENAKAVRRGVAQPRERRPIPVPAGALQKPMDLINRREDPTFNDEDTPGTIKSTFKFPGASGFKQ